MEGGMGCGTEGVLYLPLSEPRQMGKEGAGWEGSGVAGWGGGEPEIRFSKAETEHLADRLRYALVGKFSHGLPCINFLKNRLVKLDLRGTVTVGIINLKHVLIQLSNEEDFSRLWLRDDWQFDSFHMRVFKWTPKFNPQIESPIAPAWIKLPELPCHLFEKRALFGLASLIGKPLRMDEATTDLSRPSLARVCVEIDLTAPRIPAIFIEVDDFTLRQPIIYENCPQYCTFCKHLGHDQANCLSKNKGDSTKQTTLSFKDTNERKGKETNVVGLLNKDDVVSDKRKKVSFVEDNNSISGNDDLSQQVPLHEDQNVENNTNESRRPTENFQPSPTITPLE
ncbi:UNVERIFIED_CONTAM: hypothetical protein Sradi_6660500 [Sesamum radiatum]|uniref:DUF4283 domain-containing protein n=1 Tax=Sesamum radiatum TaxID=300843 RepID=A0AAW2JNR3_SESRA